MTETDWSLLHPEDFDGHTPFASLTPEEKLAWLAAVVQLAFAARKDSTSSE